MKAVNQVPRIDMSKSTTGCCALLEPSDWDNQELTFDGKLFVKGSTRSFMYVPLNMGSVMGKTQAKIDVAGAREEAFLVLSRDMSPWRADHYFAVSKEVPGMPVERITGIFLTKVFEGPYKEAGKWYRQIADAAKTRTGEEPSAVYFFYTTCPNCAKAYGKNYVVGFAQIG